MAPPREPPGLFAETRSPGGARRRPWSLRVHGALLALAAFAAGGAAAWTWAPPQPRA